MHLNPVQMCIRDRSRPSQEDIRLAYDPKMNYLILSLMNPEELVLNSFHIEKMCIRDSYTCVRVLLLL